MRMNVGTKLTVTIFSIVLAFVIINAFILLETFTVNALSNTMAEDDLPGAISALNMLDEMGDMNENVLEYLLGEPEAKSLFDSNYNEFKHYLEVMKALDNTDDELKHLNDLEDLIDSYYNEVHSGVFDIYNPVNEDEALALGNKIENQYAIPMEKLLDELKDAELADAGSSGDFDEILNDDLPGVRYYLEIIDTEGDMISTLVEYLSGETDQKEEFFSVANDFLDFYNKLLPLETRPQEIAQLSRVNNYYENILRNAETLFSIYNPDDERKAIAKADLLDDTVLTDLEDMLDDLATTETNDAQMNSAEVANTVSLLTLIIIIASLLIVIIGVVLLLFNIRSIVNPLNSIVSNIREVSIQVSAASGQLSSTSQELANGAAEQASSLEEISNSMAQLSSMVTQNSENSRQVSQLSNQSSDASKLGFEKMQGLLESMNELSVASDEIKNIISVIDGIAFQTNMLALNAAVEAARAGEAGMGFAVVADEVKNLANKSADSAQNTAILIEDSIKKIQNSLEIAGNLSETFQDILQRGGKVVEMSQELEASSEQQEDGILQINQSIAQLEKVVQSNAASAEEAASSAEELDGQSGNMTSIVEDLVNMVASNRNRSKTNFTPVKRHQKSIYRLPEPEHRKPDLKAEKSVQKGEDVIPFDDDDEYTDF